MSTRSPDPDPFLRRDSVWEKAVKSLLSVISAATVITAISTTILMIDAWND
jgi:hypothetical protein